MDENKPYRGVDYLAMTERETKYQRKLTAALTAIGYATVTGGRSQRYVEMRLGPGGRSLLRPGNEDHRVLVGPRSLRFTIGTIAQSVPFGERTVAALLSGELAARAEEAAP